MGEEVPDARRRLGVEAEAPATTAAPTLDLERVRVWAMHDQHSESDCAAGDTMMLRLADELEATREQIAAQEAMLADHGSGATTQHHWKRAALNKLRDLHALRDQHAALEVHTAELHDLLSGFEWRADAWLNADGQPPEDPTVYCPSCGAIKPNTHLHHCPMRRALATPPPQRGRELLDKVERLERVAEAARTFLVGLDEMAFTVPPDSVEHYHATWVALHRALDQGETQEVDR